MGLSLTGCSEMSSYAFVAEEGGKIVAFAAFHHHPRAAGVDPRSWTEWMRQKFPDTGALNPLNSLTLTALFGDAQSLAVACQKIFSIVFLVKSSIDTIFVVTPENITLPEVLREYFQMFNGYGQGPALYGLFREDLITPVSIRPARVEDHDDLVPVFQAQAAAAAALGEFFVARLIEGQDESNRALVAEADGRAVGLLCITTDIDLSPLHENFDLEAFDFLVKVGVVVEGLDTDV